MKRIFAHGEHQEMAKAEALPASPTAKKGKTGASTLRPLEVVGDLASRGRTRPPQEGAYEIV